MIKKWNPGIIIINYQLTSGVYFYRLSAVEIGTEKLYTSIKKMLLLK
ncbi:MAG: hypothetical protein Q8N03_16690 [Ignavibacteria bacterium]|nr:hypothetical protein [Ignavibacteria bacterium]